jgi:DNA-binding NarL/FixJ family response regulator
MYLGVVIVGKSINRVMPIGKDMVSLYGLIKLLSKYRGIRVIDAVSDCEEIIGACTQLMPDIVIADAPILWTSTLEKIKQIKSLVPAPKVILLTLEDELGKFVEACRCGVDGYLLKSNSVDQIVASIKAVSAGEVTVEPLLFQSISHNFSVPFSRNKQILGRDRLTKREVEIIRLIAKGCTNKDIAQTLDTSVRTVKNQVSSILSKMGSRNRAEASSIAMRQKVIWEGSPETNDGLG